MIKRRLCIIKLDSLIKMALFSLLIVTMSSCEDEMSKFEQQDPDRLFVTGPRTAEPDSEATYSVASGSVSWSVTGPATLSATSGEEVVVSFTGSGDVQISVSGGGLTGIADIAVSDITFEVGVSYALSGVVRDGSSDTVFFTFPRNLKAIPDFRQNGTNAADTSIFDVVDGIGQTPFSSTGEVVLTALSKYKGSNSVFYSIYTGGSDEGQIEALMQNISIVDNYGGASVDSLYFQLHQVDNVAPIVDMNNSGWDVAVANDDTDVALSITFNEAVRPIAKGEGGSGVITVDVAYSDLVGSVTDTLTATDDPAVWQLMLTVSGGSDGSLDVTVDPAQMIDLAGNVVTFPVGADVVSLNIDNTAAVAGGTASDFGNHILQIVTANGDDKWLVLESDPDVDAPTVGDFDDAMQGDDHVVVAPGDYDVYFINVDAAGNVSAIDGPNAVTIAE
jgi:hypothetical protein